MRIVSYRKPAWPEEGGMIFLGVAKWDEKIAPAKKTPPASDAAKAATPADGEEEPASVDIWHWNDVDVAETKITSSRRSSKKYARRLARGFRKINFARPRSDRTSHSAKAFAIRVRNKLGFLRDGSHHRPPDR